jgi:hypothetical protein
MPGRKRGAQCPHVRALRYTASVRDMSRGDLGAGGERRAVPARLWSFVPEFVTWHDSLER